MIFMITHQFSIYNYDSFLDITCTNTPV